MFAFFDNLHLDARSVRILLCLTLGAVLVGLASNTTVRAQTEDPSPPIDDPADEYPPSSVPELLFVLDLSGSMDERVADGRKLDLAIDAIDDAYRGLVEQGTHVNVLGYSGECLMWPPPSLVDLPQVYEIDWSVESVSLWADGGTPTDLALASALYRMGIVDSLMDVTGRDSGTIVLISDGASNGCVDPCTIAQQYGGERVTVHSIGFDLAESEEAVGELACIAKVTGGVAVTVADYEELQEEVAKLARLRTSIDLRQVEVQGTSLDVELALANNVALDDAYLNIVGPSSLLGIAQIDISLGRLESGDTRTHKFLWSATPCDSLSTIVEFSIGGVRIDSVAEVEAVSEDLAAIVTVEEILLMAMTQRELDGRCGDFVSSAQSSLLSAGKGSSSTANVPSKVVTYGGAGLASLLAGMAASRSRRGRSNRSDVADSETDDSETDESSATRTVEVISDATDYTGAAVKSAKGGIDDAMSASAQSKQSAIRLSRTVTKLDKVLSVSVKRVPVVGGGVALLACAVNDPTAECVVCSAAVVGTSTIAGAAVGVGSLGLAAIPAAMAVGGVTQLLWDSVLADSFIGSLAVDGVSVVWDKTTDGAGWLWDKTTDGAGWLWDKVATA